MRIALINPPVRIMEPPKHIPYGLAILAALADEIGVEVGILDMNAFRLNREQVRKELKEDLPWDMIGIGGLITTYGAQKELLPWLKKDHPNTLIVAGGGCATSIPLEYMKWNPDVDVLIVGEGERTFMELLPHLDDWDFGDIQGIIYREDFETKRDNIVETPRRPLLTEDELNELPYPAWELLPMEEVYFRNSPLMLSAQALNARRRIDIISERGCPMRCTFCFHNGLGGDLLPDGNRLKPVTRWQSAEYVVEMMKFARMRMGIDFVSFLDENFLANKKRAMEICELLEDEDLIGLVNWGCLGHSKSVDPELLFNLREAGCTYISYGFESADQRMLDSIKKKQVVGQMQAALTLTMKSQINPVTTFMVGYPEEDLLSLYNTLKFWIKNGIRCVPFFITPYPQTELFNKYREQILEQYDGDYEAFVLALGDATAFTVNLTKFSDPELLGLRDLMTIHNMKRFLRHAKRVGEPIDDPEPLPHFDDLTFDISKLKEQPLGGMDLGRLYDSKAK